MSRRRASSCPSKRAARAMGREDGCLFAEAVLGGSLPPGYRQLEDGRRSDLAATPRPSQGPSGRPGGAEAPASGSPGLPGAGVAGRVFALLVIASIALAEGIVNYQVFMLFGLEAGLTAAVAAGLGVAMAVSQHVVGTRLRMMADAPGRAADKAFVAAGVLANLSTIVVLGVVRGMDLSKTVSVLASGDSTFFQPGVVASSAIFLIMQLLFAVLTCALGYWTSHTRQGTGGSRRQRRAAARTEETAVDAVSRLASVETGWQTAFAEYLRGFAEVAPGHATLALTSVPSLRLAMAPASARPATPAGDRDVAHLARSTNPYRHGKDHEKEAS